MKNTSGIDFFPFNTNFFEDDKIALIEGEFGVKGAYIAIRLMCKIYNTEGYYCQWGRDECLLFTRRLGDGFSSNLVSEVIKGLIRRSFFDAGVFDSFNVLTSRGIQTRYLEATKRRQAVYMRRELILADISSYSNVKFIEYPVEAPVVAMEESAPVMNNEPKERAPTSRTRAAHRVVVDEASSDLEIMSFFFFSNFAAPQKELEKMKAYNLTGNRNWNMLNAEQRLATARFWTPKDNQGNPQPKTRFKADFLNIWKKVYEYAKKSGVSEDILLSFLSDKIRWFPDRVVSPAGSERKECHILFLANNLKDYLMSNRDAIHPMLSPLMNGKTIIFQDEDLM